MKKLIACVALALVTVTSAPATEDRPFCGSDPTLNPIFQQKIEIPDFPLFAFDPDRPWCGNDPEFLKLFPLPPKAPKTEPLAVASADEPKMCPELFPEHLLQKALPMPTIPELT